MRVSFDLCGYCLSEQILIFSQEAACQCYQYEDMQNVKKGGFEMFTVV